jgi:acyl transferase domain-containing protein/NAD(P)-dependent dehydrogenase (short-subunit alcohol dehydrogenase family)
LTAHLNSVAEPLAIIGIGCLFPRAGNFRAFWANVRDRVDAVTDVPPTHWRPEDYLDEDPKTPDRVYVARGAFLEPVPFPPTEFGIAPNNLEATDTAQLLGLMVAKAALDDAGYDAGRIDRNRVGCILGVTGTLELVIPLGARLGHPVWRRALAEAGVPQETADDVVRRIGENYVGWQENSFPGLLGNVVAGRIANRLDLGGTNCVVDAACASSLSAVHLAALELQTGRADMVLTGGVDTFNDIFMYMCFSKTPALSPTGDARPFDRDGDGTILGEGLGMVVLKRLSDARRDGDRVYAVLKGVGTSSDGRGNAVYAPKAAGQIEALRSAYRAAGITPDTIELVEAHGTGTRVGDATEVEALTEVFATCGFADRSSWCALGSIKSQLGHTKAAAGAAGLIKAVAALYHKVLPPTLKVRQPLEALASGRSPFYVNTEKRPWLPSADHPRRAGVSAFGFGGSNFHCILEEADPQKREIDWDAGVQLLALTAESVEAMEAELANWPADLGWDELSARAARSRREWRASAPHRLVLVARRGDDLGALLESARALLRGGDSLAVGSREGVYHGRGERGGKLAVLFPGQGAQYVGMLRDLACAFPAFFDTLVAADRAFAASHEPAAKARASRLSDLLYPGPVFDDDARRTQEAALRDTRAAQPALGAVGLGAWRVLESFGVRGDLFAGHSHGELTALCAAGRLDAADFLALSCLRGRLMAEGRGGAMLAVHAPLDAVLNVLREERLDLALANRNAPDQSVVSGAAAEIDRAAAAFTARGMRTTRLAVSAAFHSPAVAGAVPRMRDALDQVTFRLGAPVFANSTAAEYPDEAPAARDLLAGQLVRPVEFVALVERMYAAGARSFLEVGPGARLTGLVGQILHGRPHDAFALEAASGRRPGFFDLACALAWLAAQGQDVNLSAWGGAAAQEPVEKDRPGLVVPICGANYVKPKKEPPSRPAARTNAQPQPANNGAVTPTMNGHSADRLPPRAGTEPPRPVPPAPADTSALAQALQVTRESLAALQRMQEQAAQLHRQFLEGQETAQRTVHLLVEQQRRLLETSLGLAPAAVTSPPPVVATPPVVPTPTADAARPSENSPVYVSRSTNGDGSSTVEAVLREVVSEKTGYPAEMLEPGMALDADLGIDSIKRVEILSALQERLPDAPAVRSEHLASLRTLGDIATFLAGNRSQPPERRPAATAVGQASGLPEEPVRQARCLPHEQAIPDGCAPSVALERSVLRAAPLEPSSPRDRRLLQPGREIWLTNDDEVLAPLVELQLRRLGFFPRGIPFASLADRNCPESLAGLVLLAPPVTTDVHLRQALSGVRRAASALRRAGRDGGAVLLTVSRLDGAFGLSGLDPDREPTDGGLAGLAKTAAHEWPEVGCRALDLAPGLPPDEAAAALVDELFLTGPVEVGIGRAGRCTPVLVSAPLAAVSGTPFDAGEVIVVSGGARGVTAEAALALARAFRPTLVLLGRSPEPAPEPDWLAGLTAEADVKRALHVRANGNSSPRLLGERYRGLMAGREVRHNLARIAAAGARVVYRALDVRDRAAVAAVLGEVRREFGPVRGLVHGAGVLADARIEDKTDEQFNRVFATKVEGLHSLLAAVDLEELRALVLFSSSTGRFGRAGQVDYAMANEVLNKTAGVYSRRLPHCRVVAVNWGPWDGGMVTPALKSRFAEEGVGIIPPAAGAEYLVNEIRSGAKDAEVVVLAAPVGEAVSFAGRSGEAGSFAHAKSDALPVAFERVLDVVEHPVLASHVLDGRPVLPLALTLEWLAHAALHQNPGLAFHGVDGLRVLHGVVLDGPPPLLRVAAGRVVKRDGLLVVPAELRGRRQDGREILHARAEVVLAADLPPAPPGAPPPPLGSYSRSVEEAYRDVLFHGPALQGIEAVDGYGPAGMAATVRTAPAPAAWLNAPLRQRWLADPLALDCAFQMMVLWSAERHGAVSLPCFAARYRQFRRAYPADGIRVVARVTRDTGTNAVTDFDFLDARGLLVARMEGCEAVIDPNLWHAFRRNRLATATALCE